MTNVNVTKTINVSAESAWEKLSTFKGIENFSPVAKSVVNGEGVGATRTCYMPDNAEINEVLNKLDNENMEFEYAITSGPFPVEGYVSTVKVTAVDTNSCSISWGCVFNADDSHVADMSTLFGGFYNVIIDSLETLIKKEVEAAV